MAYYEGLALRISAALGEQTGILADITEKKMFGGITFMLNGNMCVGVTGDDLMVRVGPDGLADAMDQPDARPMDFTGRPMKGFVYVSPSGTKTDDSLKKWIRRGVAFAETLPVK